MTQLPVFECTRPGLPASIALARHERKMAQHDSSGANLITEEYPLPSTLECAPRVAKATCCLVMRDAALASQSPRSTTELLLLTNQQILPLRILRPVLTSVDLT